MTGVMLSERLAMRLRRMVEAWEKGTGQGAVQVASPKIARAINWMLFVNQSGDSIPGCGVFVGRRATEGHVEAEESDALDCRPCYIAGPGETIHNGERGFCAMADGDDIQAAYAGTAPLAGDLVGVKPNTFKVYQYLPGFRAVSDGSAGYVWVRRDPFVPPYAAKFKTELSVSTPAQGELYTTKEGHSLDVEVEVWCKLAGSASVDADGWGAVWLTPDGRWECYAAECP